MSIIAENVTKIQKIIQTACDKSGRSPENVKIVAVSKGFDPEQIKEVLKTGIQDFGENYLQESLPKQTALAGLGIRWHFTGHLQRNKALAVSRHFELIQSIDTLDLAKKLNELGLNLGKKIQGLLQIRATPQTAHGFIPEELYKACNEILLLKGLEILGLMTLAAPMEDPENAREFFQTTKHVFDKIKPHFPENFSELSMGMSGDFQVAVEEGATMVRIGRAIFGQRPSKKEIR